jgi:hypothetical protein
MWHKHTEWLALLNVREKHSKFVVNREQSSTGRYPVTSISTANGSYRQEKSRKFENTGQQVTHYRYLTRFYLIDEKNAGNEFRNSLVNIFVHHLHTQHSNSNFANRM